MSNASRRVRPQSRLPGIASVAVLLAAVTTWHVAAVSLARPYLLPTPAAVLQAGWLHRDRLLWHLSATLTEVTVGFAIGFATAVVLGYGLYRFPALERTVMPFVVASQAIPIVAVAPLLVFWFGSGLEVKAAAAAIIVFFPMLINTVVGLREIDPAYRELMRSLAATGWQTLRYLEIPAALPVLLAGVRVGATLSIIGAVVGEFLGSSRGLGALVLIAGGAFDDALRFAALGTLVALAIGVYALAAGLERHVLRSRHLA